MYSSLNSTKVSLEGLIFEVILFILLSVEYSSELKKCVLFTAGLCYESTGKILSRLLHIIYIYLLLDYEKNDLISQRKYALE